MGRYRFKALLSMGLAAALILSLLPSSGLPASAEPDYTVEASGGDYTNGQGQQVPSKFDNEKIGGRHADNLLAGRKLLSAERQFDGQWQTLAVDETEQMRWINGQLQDESIITLGGNDANDTCRFVYDLGKPCTITEFLVIGAKGQVAGQNGDWHEEYTISFANSAQALFTADANKILVHNNKTSSDTNPSYAKEILFKANESTSWTGQYIGVEINGYGGIWIDELAAYGPAPGGYDVAITGLDTAYLQMRPNLLSKGNLVSAQQQTDGGWADLLADNAKQEELAAWTDGAVGRQAGLGSDKTSRVVYALGEAKDIRELLAIGAPNDTVSGGWWHKGYKAYVADNQENLFNAANLVVSHSNVESSSQGDTTDIRKGTYYQRDFSFRAEQAWRGRFVGFEIEGGGGNLCLDELAAYETALPASAYTATAAALAMDGLTARIQAADGRNILKNKPVTAKRADSGEAWAPNEGEYTASALTDGFANNAVNVGDRIKYPLRFQFDLEGAYKVSEITLFAHPDSPGPSHRNYKISIADKEEELFTKNQKALLYCDNQGKLVNYRNQSDNTVFTFACEENKETTGRWIGVQIQGDHYDGGHIRLSEIAVFGEDATPRDYTVSAEKVTDDKELGERVEASFADNVLKGKPASAAKASDGSAWTEGHNAQEWTDGRYNFPINVGQTTDSPLRFVFDAGSRHKISEILLFAHNGNSGPNHRRYTISIADEETDLFTENANATINYTNPGDQNVFSFAYEDEAKRPEGRWIGLEIHGASDAGGNIQMREIAVFGENLEPPTYEVVSEGLDEAYVNNRHSVSLLRGKLFTAQRLEQDAWTEWRVGDDVKRFWTNGVLGDTNHLWEGPGRFVYDLEKSGPITEVVLMAATGQDQAGNQFSGNQHQSYRISIADTPAALFTEAAAEDITYQNVRNAAGLSFRFLEGQAPAGRYIGVEIHGPSWGANNIWMDEVAVYDGTPPPPVPETHAVYDVKTTGVTSAWLSERKYDNLLLGLTPKLTTDLNQEAKFEGSNEWNLVDGQIYAESHADYLSPNGDNEPISFTYDLLQSVPIDEFVIVHYWFADGVDFTTQEYELYIGDDRDTLYTAANRAVYYNNRGRYNPAVPYSGTQQRFIFKEEDGVGKPVGRYIGLRVINISGADKRGRLDQLAVYSNGVKPKDAAVAQSFEDAASGVRVSILRSRADDLFSGAAGLRIRRGEIPAQAQAAAGSAHLKLLDSALTIELLDASGNVLGEAALGGRIVKIELPMPEKSRAAGKRLCRVLDGELQELPYTFFGDASVTTYLRGSLGTLAVFEDMLRGAVLPGAADIGGDYGNLNGDKEPGGETPPTGVPVSWLLALPPAALTAMGIFRKRRGGGQK